MHSDDGLKARIEEAVDESNQERDRDDRDADTNP